MPQKPRFRHSHTCFALVSLYFLFAFKCEPTVLLLFTKANCYLSCNTHSLFPSFLFSPPLFTIAWLFVCCCLLLSACRWLLFVAAAVACLPLLSLPAGRLSLLLSPPSMRGTCRSFPATKSPGTVSHGQRLPANVPAGGLCRFWLAILSLAVRHCRLSLLLVCCLSLPLVCCAVCCLLLSPPSMRGTCRSFPATKSPGTVAHGQRLPATVPAGSLCRFWLAVLSLAVRHCRLHLLLAACLPLVAVCLPLLSLPAGRLSLLLSPPSMRGT